MEIHFYIDINMSIHKDINPILNQNLKGFFMQIEMLTTTMIGN